MYFFKVHNMGFYFCFIMSLIIFSSAFPENILRLSKKDFERPDILFPRRRNHRIDKYLSPSCPESDLLISSASTPYGNMTAGIYTKKSAKSIEQCVGSCCDDANCNVAFLFNGTCYAIQCRSRKSCKPIKSGKEFVQSILIIVSLPDVEIYYDELEKSDLLGDSRKSISDTLYDDDDELGKDTAVPVLDNNDSTITFYSEALGHQRYCVYGLNDCPDHETCIPRNQRARTGLCHCKEDYERDLNGYCKIKHSTTVSSHHITLAPSTSSAMESLKNNTGFDKSTSAYASPVHHLVVSVGENATFHLPEDEVKLYGNHHKWQNAAHENKPLIAIIQPSNVTLKLPNKDKVLDGTFNTDDDKRTKYQWEVLQVPIGYTVQLNETPTLQLKNLIPGMYIFKLTVTDSEGAFNSTLANITVQKETDYPLTTNPKTEVVIYLPQNDVTLKGNLNTDIDMKSWEWKNSPVIGMDQEAVDLEGTNGPYLHLSQLGVGINKFILNVTDTTDETSTTEVHLFVKPESNSPSVTVTGLNQKITLDKDP